MLAFFFFFFKIYSSDSEDSDPSRDEGNSDLKTVIKSKDNEIARLKKTVNDMRGEYICMQICIFITMIPVSIMSIFIAQCVLIQYRYCPLAKTFFCRF